MTVVPGQTPHENEDSSSGICFPASPENRRCCFTLSILPRFKHHFFLANGLCTFPSGCLYLGRKWGCEGGCKKKKHMKEHGGRLVQPIVDTP